VGLVNVTAANPQAVTGNYIQNFLYYSTNLAYTDIVTDSVRDRASYSYTLTGGTWYKTKIVLDDSNASFYNPDGTLLRSAAYTPSKLFPAFPFFRHEGPAITYFDLYTIRKYANPEPTSNSGSETTLYDQNSPSIYPNSPLTFTSLSGFTESATKNGGEIKYQISNDGGTTWYWYNSGWTTTSAGYTEANTASDINTNIATFPTGDGQFLFKAYLNSDGTQLVQLDSVDLTYANTRTLTYTAGSNGSITGDSPQTVDYGSDGSAVTAVPSTGYHFVNWSDSSTANPRTDTNVTDNISVTANFEATAPTTYTITPSAGSNGSISPSGATTVNSGDNQTFTITANSGYHISDVIVDGSSVGAVSTYTFSDVTANHTISATFAITSSGGGGMPVGWLNVPVAPTGGFNIIANQGVSTTTSRVVTLNFNAGSDVKKNGNFFDWRLYRCQPRKLFANQTNRSLFKIRRID